MNAIETDPPVSWIPSAVPRLAGLATTALALAVAAPAEAQEPLGLWEADPDPLVTTVREGIDAYYRFEYDEALAAFDRVRRARPDHPLGPFLKAEAYWWLFLNDRQNVRAKRRLEANLERAIELAKARLEIRPDDVETLFVLGSAYGRRGMLAGTRKDAWDAARDAKRAKEALDRVGEHDPGNADAAAAQGLYQYYVGTFGAVTRAASRLLFGLKGDKEEGLAALDRARREGTYTRTEAAFFQGLFYLQFEDRPDAARAILDRLRARYPGNLYFATMAAYARQRQGRFAEAATLYRSTLDRLAVTRVYGREGESITRFFYGQTLLGLGKNRQAWEQFVRVVRLGAEESDSYPHAYLWLGRLADLRGEREITERYYRKVLSLPDAADSHDAADRLMDDPFSSRQVRTLVAGRAR
ncbi:MAG: tetratricopeptide repeat protein [Gemmatimonadota bacterium]|nr:tetratricopeptide repeat protein [Gemmatimonadota bacterium]